MGLQPTKAAGNIYSKCRKEAAKYNDKLNSREGAAELLGISSSTLADYELGITKFIPAENILRMADLYNAPEIKNDYCRNCCPLGNDVPTVDISDLDRISIRALSTFRKLGQTKEMLLDITEDGIIDETERPTLDSILETLSELEVVAQSLKYWVKKNL